jgi:hypothetical protein
MEGFGPAHQTESSNTFGGGDMRLAQDQVRELAELPVRVGSTKAVFDLEQGG